MSQHSLTRLLVDGKPVEGDVGARTQAALDEYDRERKRRMFVDGEVITVGGRFVDPERVTNLMDEDNLG